MIITRWGSRFGYTRYGTKDDTSFLVQDLQAEAYDVQAVQELFTSFIKVRDWLEHQGEQADGAVDGEWMDEK